MKDSFRLYPLIALCVVLALLNIWTSSLLTSSSRNLYQTPSQLKEDIAPIMNSHNPDGNKTLKRIYFITPTYDRLTQRVDMLRLVNTLHSIENLLWLVVEDANTPSQYLREYLESTGIPFVHLAIRHSHNNRGHRGVAQRNMALNYLEELLNTENACDSDDNENAGIIYFGDDDNSFDLRLFDQLRAVKRFSIFPVGLIPSNFDGYESPIWNEQGKIVNWNSIFMPSRTYRIDMAGFAFSTKVLCENNFDMRFSFFWRPGTLEDKFMQWISKNVADVEPPIHREVLAHHSKSQTNSQIKSYSREWRMTEKVIPDRVLVSHH